MQTFSSKIPVRLAYKYDILGFCVNINYTHNQTLLLSARLCTKVATSSQFAVHWWQLLRRLCLAGCLNIWLRATPPDADELCVHSVVCPVTSSVR
jgi:hypothetical protein